MSIVNDVSPQQTAEAMKALAVHDGGLLAETDPDQADDDSTESKTGSSNGC